jgi:hypothetical protein
MPDAGERDTIASPYRVLVRHFFGRFFDNESLSPQAEPTANLGPILAVLALPGAFLGILLLPLTLTGWSLVTFRYFFVSFSMIVMAFILVFRWDALFPDRRDYLILTPLPVRPATIFLAKASAIGLFLGLFLLDLNITGTLIWPAIDQGPNSLHCLTAHAVAVTAAGLFSALAIGTLQGTLVNLLPAGAFHRVSAWLQTGLMAALVMLLFVTPVAAHALRGLAGSKHPILHYVPTFWFAGLYEQLRPVTRDAVLFGLGDRAVHGLAVTAIAFLLTWIPAYRMHARKFGDVPSVNPAGPGWVRRAAANALNRWVATTPVQRAVFHFITQTITRSMKHRVFLAVYAGFGVAVAALSLASGDAGRRQLPLTLSFVMISGLRAAFNFPSDLKANWVFQLTEYSSGGEYDTALRKWILVCGIVPLFTMLAPFSPSVFHFLSGVALSMLLVEIMFFGFRKVAFTCACFPGRVNLIGLGVIYIFGFTAYSRATAAVQDFLAGYPAAAVVSLMLTGCACLLLARRNETSREPLDYEGAADPVVRTLGVDLR